MIRSHPLPIFHSLAEGDSFPCRRTGNGKLAVENEKTFHDD
jgi:hypothetical protein